MLDSGTPQEIVHPPAPDARRWRQFSLRTMLVAIALVVGLAWFVKRYERPDLYWSRETDHLADYFAKADASRHSRNHKAKSTADRRMSMTAASEPVWTFFYGTFMHPDVLAEHGVRVGHVEPARLNGYDIQIRPRVNLVRADGRCVYGSLAPVTRDDLIRLYTHLEKVFNVTYFPRAVLGETLDGRFHPALCYLATHMPEGPAAPAYVDELAACVRRLGLPDWYARHIESFRPSS